MLRRGIVCQDRCVAGRETRLPVVAWADRLLYTLSSWSSPRIFGAFQLWFGAWTVAVAVVVEAVLSAEQQDELSEAAASVVGALGVLFSFSAGIVLIFVYLLPFKETRKVFSFNIHALNLIAYV